MADKNLSVKRLKGVLGKPTKSLTVAEMDEAVRQAVLRRAASAKAKPEKSK